MSLIRLTGTGDIRVVKGWARPQVYENWLALLDRRAYYAAAKAMNVRIDRMDVVRAQYVVCKQGGEWFEVYWPIAEAMSSDREFAGKFLGLILWDVMFNRPEAWAFHKIDKTIINEYNLIEDIQVIEYFRAKNFPKRGRWRDAA